MSDRLFPPSRDIALKRLAAFVPKAAHVYAAGRNTDTGPDDTSAVSKLSPYVRRRVITEREIVSTVLAHHSLQAAEKFIQEVLWRTYWKGWLEMRPTVWTRFLAERDDQRDTLGDHRALAAAENGLTGIEGFDDWARELKATGYLHNHARMWFASIWIFTLRLPWALGADFFLRHLIDADPASNTLSWRWVAGLQTPGKTYLATKDNIARYTNGRFAPEGLAREAIALHEPALEAPRALPPMSSLHTASHKLGPSALLLITDEDMHPESIFTAPIAFKAAHIVVDTDGLLSPHAHHFTQGAASDLAPRVSTQFDCPTHIENKLDAKTLIDAAHTAGVRQIITAYAPVGPVADTLAPLTGALADAGIALIQVRRDWDERFWPYATKGFFSFKDKIPALLHNSGQT